MPGNVYKSEILGNLIANYHFIVKHLNMLSIKQYIPYITVLDTETEWAALGLCKLSIYLSHMVKKFENEKIRDSEGE